MISVKKNKKSKKICKSTTKTINSSSCNNILINCCTPQYSRLYGFLTTVMTFYAYSSWSSATNPYWAYDRSGNPISPPNILSAADNEQLTNSVNLNGSFYNVSQLGSDSNLYQATNLSNTDSDNDTNTFQQISYLSYYFVNQFAYGIYEPGCKSNQIWGWFVDLSQGQLQLYTMFNNVPTNITRRYLINQLTLTSMQKSQLKILNILYKMTKCAIKKVNGVPSSEGNILEMTDCKGKNWLLYLNTSGPVGGSFDFTAVDNNVQTALSSNTQFTIIACKL